MNPQKQKTRCEDNGRQDNTYWYCKVRDCQASSPIAKNPFSEKLDSCNCTLYQSYNLTADISTHAFAGEAEIRHSLDIGLCVSPTSWMT